MGQLPAFHGPQRQRGSPSWQKTRERNRGAGKFFNELLDAKLHAPQSYSFADVSRRFIAIPHLVSIAQ
jgi:hypothetical protein